MDIDHRKLGVGIVVVGFLLLLSLRFWASPLALLITDRAGVSVVTFLLLPVLLVFVGAGIVIALWGDELGLA